MESLITGLCIAVVLFLVLRELWCWYWKINQGLDLLTEIRDDLAAIRGRDITDVRVLEIHKKARP